MSKKVNWIIADQNITVNYDGQTHIISRTDPNAAKLIAALKEKRYDDIPNLVSVAKQIETMSNGKFVVKDGEIFIDGVVVPSVLGRKIKEFAEEGLPYEPLVLFAKNLQRNPSFRATQHLYEFLEKHNHPITDNGFFVAYKKVRPDFKDIHSGTFDNSPGQVVQMPRNQVNEDPTVACSYGLHASSWEYAHDHFGSSTDIMLEVEIDPADVVAIPFDYSSQKMRVCKYKVLGVVEKELCTPLRKVNPEPRPYDYEMEEDDWEEEEDLEDEEDLEEEDDYDWDTEIE